MLLHPTLPTAWGRLLNRWRLEISDGFVKIFGSGLPCKGSSENAKWEPQLLDVYNGVLLCRLDPEWRGDDGGVYVGRGNAHTTCSVL